ncbi:MAG: FG-GAP repeat domain-containing protein [Fimbriimonadaceae bacterium]
MLKIKTIGKFSFGAVAATALIVAASDAAAQFSPNKVAVVKAAVADPGGATPFTIDQFPSQSTSGHYNLRRTVPVGPAASSIANRASISSVDLLEGGITSSPEGRRMFMAGYRNSFPGGLPSSFASASPRSFVEATTSGRIRSLPFTDDSFTAGTVRSASARDEHAYMVGSSTDAAEGGLRYRNLNDWPESVAIDGDPLKDFVSVRVIENFVVAAYNTAAGFEISSYGIVPTGPTAAFPVLTQSGSSIRDFWVAGPDRIYVAKTTGLSRYDLNIIWIETELTSFPGTPLRMDGRPNGTGFELFVTTFAASNNSLVRVSDTTSGDTSTVMASAGPLHTYRGVVVTPDVFTAWVYENEVDDLIALHAIGNDGSITESRKVPMNGYRVGQAPQSADFDGDGFYDILFEDFPNDKIAIWLMDGIDAKSSRIYNVPSNTTGAFAADLDGDGKSDLIFFHNVGLDLVVSAWIMDGLNVVSSGRLGIVPPSWFPVEVMSYTRDGRYQIFFHNGGDTDALAAWVMNGLTVEGSRFYGILPNNWEIVSRVDFNADGVPDLLLRDNIGNQAAIWYIGQDGRLVGRRQFIVAPDWYAAVGFNTFDDGRGSIAWFNAVTGQGRMFHMQTESTYTWFDFDGTPFDDWFPIGAGDPLGRGRDQLALVNPSSSEFALWGFDGYKLNYSDVFEIPADWDIVRPLMPPGP